MKHHDFTLDLSTVMGSVWQSMGKLKPNLSGQRFRKCRKLDNTGEMAEKESNPTKWFMNPRLINIILISISKTLRTELTDRPLPGRQASHWVAGMWDGAAKYCKGFENRY